MRAAHSQAGRTALLSRTPRFMSPDSTRDAQDPGQQDLCTHWAGAELILHGDVSCPAGDSPVAKLHNCPRLCPAGLHAHQHCRALLGHDKPSSRRNSTHQSAHFQGPQLKTLLRLFRTVSLPELLQTMVSVGFFLISLYTKPLKSRSLQRKP